MQIREKYFKIIQEEKEYPRNFVMLSTRLEIDYNIYDKQPDGFIPFRINLNFLIRDATEDYLFLTEGVTLFTLDLNQDDKTQIENIIEDIHALSYNHMITKTGGELKLPYIDTDVLDAIVRDVLYKTKKMTPS